ncbi:hypothetical protein Ae201684P_017236 [Aphanomyces euteiches]|nr:hypothetical protein Ae201684P_017236 [Aphanomyces euteiches]
MQNVLGTRVHQSCDQRLPQCNRQLTQRVQSKNSRRLKIIDYMSGYKRMIAELKEEGEMPLHEGKEPIAIFGAKSARWRKRQKGPQDCASLSASVLELDSAYSYGWIIAI